MKRLINKISKWESENPDLAYRISFPEEAHPFLTLGLFLSIAWFFSYLGEAKDLRWINGWTAWIACNLLVIIKRDVIYYWATSISKREMETLDLMR